MDLKLRTDKYVYEHAQLALLYLKLCRENMCTDVNEMTDLDFEREQLLCHYEEAIKKGVEEIVYSKEKTITLLIKLVKAHKKKLLRNFRGSTLSQSAIISTRSAKKS